MNNATQTEDVQARIMAHNFLSFPLWWPLGQSSENIGRRDPNAQMSRKYTKLTESFYTRPLSAEWCFLFHPPSAV